MSLEPEEWATLRCQIGTSSEGRGGRRCAPNAFAEQAAPTLGDYTVLQCD